MFAFSVSELQDLASGGSEEILLHYIKATPQFEAVTALREKTWKENEELASKQAYQYFCDFK